MMRKPAYQLVFLTMLISSPLIGITGCEGDQIDEKQTAQAFNKDVETRLNSFDSRLSEVKSQMSGREEAVRNRIETFTEQAEEKIETLRDSAMPQLTEAATTEERDRIKDTINDTLTGIEQDVKSAESVLADVKTTRERFTESTNETLSQLRDRYDDLKGKAEGYEGSAKAELDLALESAEEAIQEAGDSLDEYKSAAQEQAGQMRDTIDSLVADAGKQLDKAAEAMKN